MPDKDAPQLPSFDAPPVNEVICGLTFRPLLGMLAPHLGILWGKYRQDYPVCKEADPLIPVLERFDTTEPGLPDLRVPLLPRVWYISKDENAIIQVQRDRFLHNWRKVRPTDAYPRYGFVKEQFQEKYAAFVGFLEENQLGAVEPIQFEMTYLNHIPQGSGWTSTEEIGKVFPDFNWRKGERFLSKPEQINWRTSFVLPEQAGRLHISIQTAVRRQDRVPIAIAELTVRGISQECTIDSFWPWLDAARSWIVRGFADITGEEVQRNVWRRLK